jgi:hypothetical protein
VREGAFKYVDLPIPELYDLDSDPGETRNLAASRPPSASAPACRLREGERGIEQIAESREAVSACAPGYVGGTTR